MSIQLFDGIAEEIRTTICNAEGTRPFLFVPEIQMSFDILVKRQIRRLREPGIFYFDLVYEDRQRNPS